ncbi:phosphoglycolate phosphatase [Paraburkholderia phenazinium]|uniref:Phosphoglycolate phosphatase n=2 Tax=Paraburkholderia phenazinium TaxID=60549 RepID=A0A1G8IMF9_9BURK|nr:phosphoglycolate phosphatase [Paraburkholderia phenazinium]
MPPCHPHDASSMNSCAGPTERLLAPLRQTVESTHSNHALFNDATSMKTLLFDLDGTLSDPLVGISRSVNYALTSLGYAALPETEFAQYIGPPLDDTFKLVTGAPDAEIRQLIALYRERYAETGFAENTLYPGVEAALNALAQKGSPMGICTSKLAQFADKILRRFGIRDHFGFISGGDVGVTKQQQIARLLSDGTVDTQAWMIGDRSVDLMAAHANGIESVGVLWGYGSREELSNQLPRRLLERVDELPTLADLQSS